MTSIEVVGFSVLWLVLLALAALVLLLYRQVEKAYRRSTGASDSALSPGARAPDIALVGAGAGELLPFPDGEPVMLAFVAATCDSCRALMRELDSSVQLTTFALVTGDGLREYAEPANPKLHTRWVASPADIHEQYRVDVVPTLYVVRDRKVLAATTDGSAAGLRRLVADARLAEDDTAVAAGSLSLGGAHGA